MRIPAIFSISLFVCLMSCKHSEKIEIKNNYKSTINNIAIVPKKLIPIRIIAPVGEKSTLLAGLINNNKTNIGNWKLIDDNLLKSVDISDFVKKSSKGIIIQNKEIQINNVKIEQIHKTYALKNGIIVICYYKKSWWVDSVLGALFVSYDTQNIINDDVPIRAYPDFDIYYY